MAHLKNVNQKVLFIFKCVHVQVDVEITPTENTQPEVYCYYDELAVGCQRSAVVNVP